MMNLRLQTKSLKDLLAKSRMPLFIVMVGVPGSGKTTLARELAPHIEPVVICSTDSFDPRLKGGRGMMTLLDHWAARAIMTGMSVIIDQTSMERINREQRLKGVPSYYSKVCLNLNHSIDLDECIANVKERHKQGGRNVPEQVIRDLAEKYQFPAFKEGFDIICEVIT